MLGSSVSSSMMIFYPLHLHLYLGGAVLSEASIHDQAVGHSWDQRLKARLDEGAHRLPAKPARPLLAAPCTHTV